MMDFEYFSTVVAMEKNNQVTCVRRREAIYMNFEYFSDGYKKKINIIEYL